MGKSSSSHTLSKYACSSAGFSGAGLGAPTEAGFGTEAGDWTLMVLGVGTDVEGAGDAAMQCYIEKQSHKSVCYTHYSNSYWHF